LQPFDWVEVRSEGGAGEEGKEPVKEFEAIELCDKKEVRTSEGEMER